jgi:hypothetical protein
MFMVGNAPQEPNPTLGGEKPALLTVMLSKAKHPRSLSLVPNQKTTAEILRPDKSGLRMTRDFKLRFRVQENSFFERTKLESH